MYERPSATWPCIVWRTSDILGHFPDGDIQTFTPVDLLNNANIRPPLFRHTKEFGRRNEKFLSDEALTVLDNTLVACKWSQVAHCSGEC